MVPSSDGDPLSDNEPTPVAFVHRPPFQLRSLPVHYRWEVTRRHPYYDLWWKFGRSDYRQETDDNQLVQFLRAIAPYYLQTIDVSGDPPDPAREFNELDESEVPRAWQSGAVQPITVRSIAMILIRSLPKNVLESLGLSFFEASQRDAENEPPMQLAALQQLAHEPSPELDSYFDAPLVSINPEATVKQASQDIAKLLKEWKAKYKLSEKRDRSDKYPDYLRVWDLREGWAQGKYDRSQELRLKEISQSEKLPESTVHNHYRSAFELIVGHPYNADLWYRLMGPIKLTELMGQKPGKASAHRPLKTPTRAPAPQSRFDPKMFGEEELGFVEQRAITASDEQFHDLLASIRELLAQGKTDLQIVQELELTSPETVAAVACLRERNGELS